MILARGHSAHFTHDKMRTFVPAMTSIFWSLYRSVNASMQHRKAAGSRQSVVMSQNKMPFFGKFGTPRMEFATSSFFSSSSMVPDGCCSDTTEARLCLLTATADVSVVNRRLVGYEKDANAVCCWPTCGVARICRAQFERCQYAANVL